MIRLLVLVTALCVAPPLQAQDYIETRGPLSDDDFYRLVSCAADHGGPCRDPFVRWPAAKRRSIGVAITRTDPTFPTGQAKQIGYALSAAIAEINGAGAGITLVRRELNPDIKVLLMDHPERSTLVGTGIKGLDGNFIDGARVQVWWNGSKQITRAAIVMTPHIHRTGIRSVMLEELVQSLGLLKDIRNPHYRSSSIFEQDSNAVTTLRGQDAIVLKRHYAR